MKHEAGYQHWEGHHRGIWARRLVIAGSGIKACLQVKFMRYLIALCWIIGLFQVLLMFALSQLLVADSYISSRVEYLRPQMQSVVRALVTWLDQHPEVSVQAAHNILFSFFDTRLFTLSMIATALAIPHLITRDLSSRAIVIYSAKAVSRLDYLLGKFATMFGLLAATWLGPTVTAWIFGNLLSTKWSFFLHSLPVLGHSLAFVLVGMVVLSLLAMGVSAISKQAKYSVALWVALWLLGNALIPISMITTRPWLRHLSFRYNLDQVGAAIFKIQNDFDRITETIPFLAQMLQGPRGPRGRTAGELWFQANHLEGALIGLLIFIAIAILIVARKTKPE